MAAMEDKVPAIRPDGNDSDSDEAPEVVTKQSATQKALELRRQEGEARAQAKAAAKRKRKTKQDKTETEVPELPEEILSAVAARNEEDEAVEEEEVAAKARAKKRRADAKLAKLLEKKTHMRQFGNIEVKTLDAVETAKTRELSESAKEFLALREAPNRPRMNVMEGHPTQFTKKQKQRSQRA
ncbi:hypothetical protein BBO99_00008832 [Phytophthora kernoviae]|uniref:Uncharacterized protein n=2 Tax=Phytophthora kernoviae TaxID=325452 RepID=A0A3R7G5K1_9STRA|nr:hypothetical protein G195_010387 [Phytophthora kernoviae 00238/432]KAG2509836.1 hypothetical protein JM16_008572 [Phytophthora kernoviae]KAG2512359.1 hypothetical protein JM18_008596 [Phytophthora kernoviae]RLN37241.1 hypothetical protein BBI17_008852 [Phytophthora kernoviae]RLN74637.1 hypothetical protein BBO99_00008832 [Phytophthora kernoviae]